jgi:TM2 domain-containing membrane protein YozV
MSDPNQPPAGGWAAPDPNQPQQPQQPPAAGYQPPPAAGYQQPPAAGYPQPQPAYGQPAYPGQKSRMVAGLLGIFVGGFGVHRFYLGYTNIGVIQIIVTIVTCGFGAIWGLIEGILILMKNESFLTDADGVPLSDN